MLLLSSLVLALLPPSLGFDFSVETSALTQCGAMDVSFSGGVAPYTLTIIPAFDYPTNLTLPDSAITDGEGSYRWTVNYPADVQLVVMMGDATGAGAGGVSNVFQVGSGNTGCTLRSTSTDFMFYLNETSVAQCEPVEVYWDETAVSPVRVIGVIPQGQIFQFSSIGAAASMVWNTNIASGTQFILAAFNDGPFGNGGSSALMTVGQSSDSSCLDDSSPSSTPAAPTRTGTGTANNPTRTGGGIKTVTAIATAQPTGAAGLSGGAIAGIVAGVVLALLIAQAALIWFCCRRQLLALVSHRRQMKGREVKRGGDVDLASQMGDPNDVILDDTHTARYEDATIGTARSSMGGGGDRGGYAQSSISPFWDGNRVSTSQYTLDLDMGPPLRPHTHTRDNSYGSTPDGLDSASIHSPSSPLVGHPSFPASTSSSRHNSSLGNLSKAQLASSFAPSNPDYLGHGQGQGQGSGLDERQPPMTAPSGGFVREQDAGRIPGTGPPEEGETEHLPPLYDPQWQTQDPRGPRS